MTAAAPRGRTRRGRGQSSGGGIRMSTPGPSRAGGVRVDDESAFCQETDAREARGEHGGGTR